MTRETIANHIVSRLRAEARNATEAYRASQSKIGYFVIEDILPVTLARELFHAFPKPAEMVLKKSLREDKYVAAQMNKHNPLLEEAIYAFQDPRVVSFLAETCGIPDLYPDPNLYAGGLSLMRNTQFLNPHLDNSHDKDRNRWRVLNLLCYVTPDWPDSCGGNLEVWPEGLGKAPIVIHSKFNRLAVMATHQLSWHSVTPITHPTLPRCCISNYYFSGSALTPRDSFHVTSFRGRPEQPFRDLVLQGDAKLRMLIRKVFKKGIVENPHVYKK